MPAAVDGGYVNPCKEFDTANILNDLYYDDASSSSDCDGGKPSFLCSGLFIHGQDLGAGTTNLDSAAPDPLTPGKYYNFPAQTYSIGSETLASPVCPVEITEGQYPWWCPTPVAMTLGSLSFTFLRDDIAPPAAFLKDWYATGVDVWTNTTSKPNVAWSGPGHILAPADKASNPDAESPQGSSSFFDNDRIGYSWANDGDTLSRIDCGNGITWKEMVLGIDGPKMDPATGVTMQCPPSSPAWNKYASKPSGWENYCPEEVFSSVSSYYDYLVERVTKDLNLNRTLIDECSSLNLSASTTPETLATCAQASTPHGLICGIPASKFDDLYVPVQTFHNFPETKQELGKRYPNQLGLASRETLVRSFHGVGFNQLGKNLIFYADDTRSLDEALQHAADFYQKSQLGGGKPIRIPVVMLNQDNLFHQEDGSKPEVFTCPAAHMRGGTHVPSGSVHNYSMMMSSFLALLGSAIIQLAW